MKVKFMELREDIRQRIEGRGLDPGVIEALARRMVNDRKTALDNSVHGKLVTPTSADWHDTEDADHPWATHRALGEESLTRGQLGLLILNGGMATRFGGVVKGTVLVNDTTSFLGLKLKNALAVAERYRAQPPVVILMNSEATDRATWDHLRANDYFGYPKAQIWSFIQCV